MTFTTTRPASCRPAYWERPWPHRPCQACWDARTGFPAFARPDCPACEGFGFVWDKASDSGYLRQLAEVSQ